MKLKDYNLKDTIAAIATFPSKSALGVVKISGKKAIPIVSKIFKPAKTKDIKKVRTHTLHYGWIIEKVKSQKSKVKNEFIVDEVLVSVMKKPHSYTREDVVEISSHGGIIVVDKILEIIIREGARLALPGEFTYRALINGRIDLLQAEGILGIVEAKTPQSLSPASSQLRGEASQKIRLLKEEMKELFVETESILNFPEEDIEISLPQLSKKIFKFYKQLEVLLKRSNGAEVLREGLRCVICGRTNVGKSTLFNRLLKEERVIVSRFPGTTRDVIEETINIRGVPLKIYDTAGILEPKDFLAKKALDKTREAFQEADLVILILDGSRALNSDDFFLLKQVKNKNTIVAINKVDLPQRLKIQNLSKFNGLTIKMSALKNIGLKDLERAVYNKVYKGKFDRENLIFLSQYQRQILKNVYEHLQQMRIFLKEGYTLDFINASLKLCLDELGKLTGEIFSEEILESMFSRFCIGK